MLKYLVEHGYLIDLKHREGHICEWAKVYDTIERAMDEFRFVKDHTCFKEGDYIGVFEIEVEENGEFDFVREIEIYYGFQSKDYDKGFTT